MSALLVHGARQLLTLRGPTGPRRGAIMRELGLIQDGAILIEDGIITSVGPTRRIENLTAARNATEVDASGCVVAPGFVDSHTHLVCGPPRLLDYEMRIAGASYEQIARSGGGILTSVRAIRDAPIRRLVLQAQQTLDGLIRHGTTTIEAKSGYGLDETGERKILRAMQALNGKPIDIVPTYLGAHVVPPEYSGRSADYIEWVCTYLMPKIRRRKLAQFVDVYCDELAFSVEHSRRYLEAARQLGFSLKIHAQQFSRTGSVRLAVELGAISADHLERADEEDVRLLAASHTIATLLPGSVFHLGREHYPPARALIEAGAAVALATDYNPGTSPTYNMAMVLSLACTEMRMTAAEAFTAATINGAHAIGRADRIGSLEAGKNADLVMFKVPDYREIPYHFGVCLTALTMKRGVVLYRQAEVACPQD